MESEASAATTIDTMRVRIVALEALLAAATERVASLEAERDRVREAYRQLQIEMELLRRRIFAAKAERIDTAQLELEFEQKCKELDALAEELGADTEAASDEVSSQAPLLAHATRRRPTGRRDLSKMTTLPEERMELEDSDMELLVQKGRAERIGFEESLSVKWRRGCAVRMVIARITYRLAKDELIRQERELDTAPLSEAQQAVPANAMADPVFDGVPSADATPSAVPYSGTTLVTATMPPTILPRSFGTASLYARIATEKFSRGMPLFRQEEQFFQEGFPLDRGTMCRWLEELGGLLGATIVEAARKEALQCAFCIATDATGISIQPARTPENRRQACRHGHFFVLIADRDHVFFEFTPRETSAAVYEMFRGFSGYVQADAKSVYDILFRDREPPDDPEVKPDGAKRKELGCLVHARRKFYEAAIATKDLVAREALYRLHRVFENEETWRFLAPAQKKAMRDRFSRPELAAFFDWVEFEYRKVEHERGLLRSAFGYCRNHKEALMRFLDDGRLELDNNRSERELRRIAVGRKAWLFVGSDVHAQAAGNFFSLIASCKLHRLDPEAYLRDVFRVLPHWPRERHLELAPKYWASTRPRLDPVELDHEIGWLTIPAPPAPPDRR